MVAASAHNSVQGEDTVAQGLHMPTTLRTGHTSGSVRAESCSQGSSVS